MEFLFELARRRLAAAGLNDPRCAALLDRSRAAALELAHSGTPGLVHGDLHPANVLSGPGLRLVAIDPRPALGDPDFDAVDWILAGRVTDRAELDSSLGNDKDPDRSGRSAGSHQPLPSELKNDSCVGRSRVGLTWAYISVAQPLPIT